MVCLFLIKPHTTRIVRQNIRVGIFAIEPIEIGDEITFDYQFQNYGKSSKDCLCGSENCRKVIKPKDRESVLAASDFFIDPQEDEFQNRIRIIHTTKNTRSSRIFWSAALKVRMKLQTLLQAYHAR